MDVEWKGILDLPLCRYRCRPDSGSQSIHRERLGDRYGTFIFLFLSLDTNIYIHIHFLSIYIYIYVNDESLIDIVEITKDYHVRLPANIHDYI